MRAEIGMCFDRAFPAAAIAEYARRVESSGIEQLWIIEDCFFTAGVSLAATALAVTEELAGTGGQDAPMGRWWWGPWYEHENYRDERVEAFTQQLWPGVHSYRYVARATTPGAFVVPPAKAEEMYSPETFGRSVGDRLVIE